MWRRGESNPGPEVARREHLRVYPVDFGRPIPCGLAVHVRPARPRPTGFARRYTVVSVALAATVAVGPESDFWRAPARFSGRAGAAQAKSPDFGAALLRPPR